MQTNGNGHATMTTSASWSTLLAGAAGLEEVKRELQELYKRQRYLETLQAILQVAPFPLDALRAAEHDDNGVIIVDGLALRKQRTGERFPDEPRDGHDNVHRQEGLYILYNLDGDYRRYTHGWHASSLLDVVNFMQKFARTPAIDS